MTVLNFFILLRVFIGSANPLWTFVDVDVWGWKKEGITYILHYETKVWRDGKLLVKYFIKKLKSQFIRICGENHGMQGLKLKNKMEFDLFVEGISFLWRFRYDEMREIERSRSQWVNLCSCYEKCEMILIWVWVFLEIRAVLRRLWLLQCFAKKNSIL